jgi:ligand-binding SRPBCC domain-containing protein
MRFASQTEQRLAIPAERVFEFFANPENLPLLMPAWQKARTDKATIVPPPPAGVHSSATFKAAGSDSRLTLSFRPFPLFPVRLKWEAEIFEFVWDEHFCDPPVKRSIRILEPLLLRSSHHSQWCRANADRR